MPTGRPPSPRSVVAGAALGALLSGCGAPAPTASTETGWTVEACSNDDVEATLGEWDGAGGRIVGSVRFAARTERRCMLAGAPELGLIDANGQVIATAPGRAPGGGDPLVMLASGGALDPDGPRAGQGSFMFLFGNVCRPLPDGHGRVAVRLPGESEMLVFAAEIPVPPCTTPGRPPFLGVQPFASPAPD
jgi:hypothetical protein